MILKKLLPSALLLVTFSCHSQIDVGKTLEKAEEKADSTLKGGNGESGLSQKEIVNGLKEALEVGAEKSVDLASKVDGFNKNPKIRIPFPPEAEKVKKTALDMGMDKKVEEFETTMNRAAEKASEKATDIFVAAIKNMTVKDGKKILNGNDTAATHYLRKTTYDRLYEEFKPIVEKAIDEVELTKYWNPLAQAYNKSTMLSGGEEVNPDLDEYVTHRGINGLFVLIAEEEGKIRQDPAARVTDLLKKVFG